MITRSENLQVERRTGARLGTATRLPEESQAHGKVKVFARIVLPPGSMTPSHQRAGTLMRLLALLLALLPAVASAGVFTTEHVQAYPADWPTLSGMSAGCGEVQGSFVDPNTYRWEREEFPGSPLGAKYGGIREAAWIAFGLTGQEVRSEDHKATVRIFTISLRSDQSLTVSYEIDGKEVASRNFAQDKLSCGKDGLTITTIERSGVVLDKLPNEGHITRQSTIYRLNGYLYVRTASKTEARVLQVVPQSFLNVKWFRFPERTP
jgi:hypothetical protein